VSEKILFVDDDVNILNAFQRQLRKQFLLQTASSGYEGLKLLKEEGPFAVVVADMRMPVMDGIAFLKQVQEITPDSVRLMLTGNADQKTAIDAVNEGKVFRFLTKPCSIEQLVNTLEAAQGQYRLQLTERELLQGTLNGSIKLLMEILSITAPTLSGRDVALRKTAIEVARSLQIMNTWALEVATMLSHIAYVTLPSETLQKVRTGQPLTEVERTIVDHLPETGHKLLENIPRLKEVARIVLYQNKHFDGSGIPGDTLAGEEIPIESRILKILHDLSELQERDGLSVNAALARLQEDGRKYDKRILQTVSWFLSNSEAESGMSAPTGISVSELRPGQVLLSNIKTDNGRLLVTAGHELSGAIVERLINYHQVHKIKEPIMVSMPID
jgi:response regulator RpfG family c-di-GMP phosphodiesterase